MQSIAICPRCTSHLGLPAGVDSAAQVQCPICEVEFSLATVSPRELPQARLVDSMVETEGGEHATAVAAAGASPQERLSRLLRSSATWTPPARLDEAVASAVEDENSYDTAYEDADPELARQQPAQDEVQPGASRLDQLLSDLVKKPVEPAHPSAAEIRPDERSETAAAGVSFEPTLGHDFENDVVDREPAAEGEEEEVAVPSLGETDSGKEAPLDLRTAPRRKRRPAGIRTLVGIVGGGVLGIGLGAYGLLWLQGPAGDFLGLSEWLPTAMLPSSMSSMADADDADDVSIANHSDANESQAEVENGEPRVEPGEVPALVNDAETPMLDAGVIPATAEEPIADADSERDAEGPLSDTPAASIAAAPTPSATPAAWPTTPIVGDLRDVKLYSVAELGELLKSADAAHRQFLAEDLSQQQSWGTMGPAYMTIAALAERYTLTDPQAYGNELITKQLAAKNIFRGTLGDRERRTDLATIAARWLQHERRQNQGVVLIGRVRDLEPNGKWTQYTIDVPLGEGTVPATVLMDRIGFSVGEEVAVVGVILQNPQERLAGFQGDATEVVIAGYTFAPAEFVAPQATATSGLPLFDGAGAGAGE